MSTDDSAHLKNTLGYLLRTTLAQAGTFRQLLEREARSSRSWFDSAMHARRKKDLLADLGAATYDLALSGELGDLEDYPEIAERVRKISALGTDADEVIHFGEEPALEGPAEPAPEWKPLFATKTPKRDAKPAEDDTDLADYMNDDDVPTPVPHKD